MKLPYWLQRLLDRLSAMARAEARGTPAATLAGPLANTLRGMAQVHDLATRKQVLAAARESEKVRAGRPEPVELQVPAVPPDEALALLVRMEPVLAKDADLVRQIYSERWAFALAHSASLEVTQRVRDKIERGMREGLAPAQVIKEIEAEGFARSYAETVYRTNLKTVTMAARFQVAQEPEIRAALPAFEVLTANDVDVRRGRAQDNGENHQALHRYVAATDSPVWRGWTPPYGFSCRCSARLVPRAELSRRGLLDKFGRVVDMPFPRAAAKAPGFGERPDYAIYLGVGG